MTVPELVLVVPCYNEAGRLRAPVFLDFVTRHPSVRLLFVDDGSVDGTMAVLERLAQAAPAGIRAMRLPTNQGKAEAVRRGLLEAMTGESRAGRVLGRRPLDAADRRRRLPERRSEAPGRRRDPRLPRAAHGPRHPPQGQPPLPRPRVRHGRLARARPAGVRHAVRGQGVSRERRAAPRAGRRRSAAGGSSTSRSSPATSRFRWTTAARPGASRIYELTVPAWHDVPGSKLKAWDFVRSIGELAAVWRGRRSASSGRPPATAGEAPRG